MRFITEFELDYPYKLGTESGCKERAKYDMGAVIHEAFDWKELHSRVKGDFIEKKKWSLEIEAFPMDKWVEFKEKLTFYLQECEDKDQLPETLWVIRMIKQLESFGKSSGDAINNNI